MEEIRVNPHIEMTSDFPWDPATVGQRPLSHEEEERRKIVAKVKIDQHTISARPDEPQLHYDESEYDLLMSSCSAAYSERTLIQRLISSIRVASCHKEDEDLEDETDVPQRTVAPVDIRARHTAISAEEISRKFGVGLETARKTLKATTQYGIRHAVHPLSRRYRTDILQSKRKRLNDTFYTDTMFSGIKSLYEAIPALNCSQTVSLYTSSRWSARHKQERLCPQWSMRSEYPTRSSLRVPESRQDNGRTS
jgi:hypothetical protein